MLGNARGAKSSREEKLRKLPFRSCVPLTSHHTPTPYAGYFIGTLVHGPIHLSKIATNVKVCILFETISAFFEERKLKHCRVATCCDYCEKRFVSIVITKKRQKERYVTLGNLSCIPTLSQQN